MRRGLRPSGVEGARLRDQPSQSTAGAPHLEESSCTRLAFQSHFQRLDGGEVGGGGGQGLTKRTKISVTLHGPRLWQGSVGAGVVFTFFNGRKGSDAVGPYVPALCWHAAAQQRRRQAGAAACACAHFNAEAPQRGAHSAADPVGHCKDGFAARNSRRAAQAI